MAKSSSILKLQGFDDMLADIAKAGGKIDRAVETACKAGAAELESRLLAECAADGVPDSVTREIRTNYQSAGNMHKVQCGWEMGEYNPDNLSAGYKALFLNYGTPHRRKHGKVKARGFITRAKRGARAKVKRAQADALDQILRGISE